MHFQGEVTLSNCFCIPSEKGYTDNPLYTDSRYNDKVHDNDNLTVTKPSLKR